MTSPVAATIDANGITAPSYSDVFAYLVSQFQSIYGADAYLGNDSQDGQWIAIQAQAINDCNNAVVAAYNSFSPATAQGAGLSSQVKINGLRRIPGSFSTATLTVVGVAGTVITNGVAQDTAGNSWALPTVVTIPVSGTVNVVATCTAIGAVNAAGSTINSIQTPTYGWQTVNNSAAAAPGNGVETDAALRVRQGNSVALPANTIFDGIVASIEQVVGVTRIAAYENNTNATDSNAVPANNVAFAVEGGAVNDIFNAIGAVIPPGTPTFATGPGAVGGQVVDASGYTKVINFMVATPARVDVVITLHGLTGWSTATEPVIVAAIIAYMAKLPIGQKVSYTGLFLPAYLQGTVYAGTYNITAMTIAKNEGSPQTTDLAMLFNEAPFTDTTHVTFVVV